VAKRYEIEPRLLGLLTTNRKSHKLFHMPEKSFADLSTPAYGRPFLATAGLLVGLKISI